MYIRGKLIEFDQHLNLILDDAEEIRVRKGVVKSKKMNNRIIIRGDSILTVDFSGSLEFKTV
jgi:small nuclear ribonucleoprotein (snRNP)-like protein